MIRLVKEWKMDRWVGHKIVISEKLLRTHIASGSMKKRIKEATASIKKEHQKRSRLNHPFY